MPKGVLVDITRCMGCKACQVACKQWNDLPSSNPEFKEGLTSPPDMNGYTYTTVRIEVVKKDNDYTIRSAKRQCMHCEHPACASACFAKALQRDPKTGAVHYYPHLCVGCRYCMLACPFDVPKYQWDKQFPLVAKCQFCFDPKGKYDRLGYGLRPACVDTCPTGALKFGERDELLKEAWERINSNPKYIKHVMGEKEAGGTSWLYISDVPFETFGFRRNLGTRPLPEYSHNFLKWTPIIAVGWGTLLTVLYHYTKRREQIASESGKKDVHM
ncbi:4Fe-4S dicluster domain-containing protein [Desulforamulus putei]|uniref:4Fe-4S dicluster domain-containing protein n=1 Tax=Desulforamulus putei TaxID=74701 RepID=UPI002FDD0F8E